MVGIRKVATAFALIALAGSAALLSAVSPAAAAPGDGYGTVSAPGATGTITLPAGFPVISFTTDSRAPATFPGTSAYLSAGTAFGAKFGSSQGHPYLSLRPRQDSAGNPSTTTFSFATPTPIGGWGFALGDVDAEQVVISAIDAAGNPVPSTAFGVSTFNYCAAAGSGCTGTSVPTATPSPFSIAIEDLGCPTIPGQCTTAGEAASIDPTVSLSTLTVVSNWKQGFPAYQAWFATIARAVSGTMTTSCAVSAPLSAQLLDGSGAVVANSAVTNGTFSFPLVAARADYTVRADPAALPANVTTNSAPANTSASDATGVTVTPTCATSPTAVDPGAGAAAAPALAATGTDPRLLSFGALILMATGLMATGIALRAPRRQ